MKFNKLYNIVRLKELSGLNAFKASDIDNISEDYIALSEQEIDNLPHWQKTLIEGKLHIMDFDNTFVLKPVKGSTEDKSTPKVNKTKDYEKDGGDAKKVNKKMVDNELSEDFDHRLPSSTLPYKKDQVEKAKEMLRNKKSKLALKKEPSTRRERDDEEYQQLMNKKRDREERDPNKFIKRDLALESRSNAEDATVYSGTTFDSDDEQEYYGKDEVRATKIKKPVGLIKDINKRIKEIKQSIEMYDDKGYNDGDGPNSIKNKAIEALEQLRDNLKSGDYEGFKQAQLFFLTIMNPIQALFPTSLVRFLSHAVADENNTDKLTHEVTPHEDKIQEAWDAYDNRKEEVDRSFGEHVLPHVIKHYSDTDLPAMREAYNDYIDMLQRDGDITDEEADSWAIPDEMKNDPIGYLRNIGVDLDVE